MEFDIIIRGVKFAEHVEREHAEESILAACAKTGLPWETFAVVPVEESPITALTLIDTSIEDIRDDDLEQWAHEELVTALRETREIANDAFRRAMGDADTETAPEEATATA